MTLKKNMQYREELISEIIRINKLNGVALTKSELEVQSTSLLEVNLSSLNTKGE